jgi:hypothetical protein
VKKIEVAIGKEIKVELDTVLTPELEEAVTLAKKHYVNLEKQFEFGHIVEAYLEHFLE